MSPRPAADLAQLDQAHAETVQQLDGLITNVGPALIGCDCGHALDSPEHASELATCLAQGNSRDKLASLLAIALLRAIVAGGAA